MILHLSDTHFGTERAEVVAGLLALAQVRRPTLVVLSGDVTQRARRSQFDAASRFLDDLCAVSGIRRTHDVLVIPGNHDIALFNLARRLTDPYAGYAQAFGSVLEPVLRRDNVWVIGVNTTRPWRHKHGEVSTAQIGRVAAALQMAPAAALKVVVTHQPLHVVEADDRADLLRGHAPAGRAWAAAGADLMLAGHIHQSFVAPLPVADSAAWVVQTGTAVSRRTRERVPNSVHLIRHGDLPGGHRALVERWDWNGTTQFERVAATPIPARGAGPSGPGGAPLSG